MTRPVRRSESEKLNEDSMSNLHSSVRFNLIDQLEGSIDFAHGKMKIRQVETVSMSRRFTPKVPRFKQIVRCTIRLARSIPFVPSAMATGLLGKKICLYVILWIREFSIVLQREIKTNQGLSERVVVAHQHPDLPQVGNIKSIFSIESYGLLCSCKSLCVPFRPCLQRIGFANVHDSRNAAVQFVDSDGLVGML